MTGPYWNLLLPYEQRGPSRIRVRKWMRWTGRHNRIFDLEKELGFHDREAYDVLPWRHPVYDY